MKKLLQINPVLRQNTSTGRIMQEIGAWLDELYCLQQGTRRHPGVPVGDCAGGQQVEYALAWSGNPFVRPSWAGIERGYAAVCEKGGGNSTGCSAYSQHSWVFSELSDFVRLPGRERRSGNLDGARLLAVYRALLSLFICEM